MSFSTIVSSRPETRFIADKFRSIVQRNAQILAEELGQVPFPNRSFMQLDVRDGLQAIQLKIVEAIQVNKQIDVIGEYLRI